MSPESAEMCLPKPLPVDDTVAEPSTRLHTLFFTSDFFRWLHIQFPLFDAQEFPARLGAVPSSSKPEPGLELLEQTLMAWATSFGLDENGRAVINVDVDERVLVKDREESSNALVQRCLEMVDRMGVLRKMTWDGVRAVLLLLPLTTDVMCDDDRETMYRTALTQVHRLAGLGGKNSYPEDASIQIIRARTFWYAHVSEGVKAALHGTASSLPLIFDDASVASFKTTLTTSNFDASLATSPVTSGLTHRHTIAPIRLAATCRLIHDLFVYPSRRGAEGGQTTLQTELHKVWSALESSWEEFEGLRGGVVKDEAQEVVVDKNLTDAFVSSWQIFIFEAYHVIQDRLATLLPGTKRSAAHSSSSKDPLIGSRDALAPEVIIAIYNDARAKCARLLPKVLDLIRQHNQDSPLLLKYNTGFLACRGIFYVGKSFVEAKHSGPLVPNARGGFESCVQALRNMSSRWVCSDGNHLAQELDALWEAPPLNTTTTPQVGDASERPSTSHSSSSSSGSILDRREREASDVLDEWLSSIPAASLGAPVTPIPTPIQQVPHQPSMLGPSAPVAMGSNHPNAQRRMTTSAVIPGSGLNNNGSSARSPSNSSVHSSYHSYIHGNRLRADSAPSSMVGAFHPPILPWESAHDVQRDQLLRHRLSVTIPTMNAPSYSYHSPINSESTTSSPCMLPPRPLSDSHQHHQTTQKRLHRHVAHWSYTQARPSDNALLEFGQKQKAVLTRDGDDQHMMDVDDYLILTPITPSDSVQNDFRPSSASSSSSSSGLTSALGLSVLYNSIHSKASE
ncbi:hypothetical protein FRB96_006016 [Tulasnella sp. 330]|nr:hypothetical protein FRB96_006016 [Tulasnella sp. 330]